MNKHDPEYLDIDKRRWRQEIRQKIIKKLIDNENFNHLEVVRQLLIDAKDETPLLSDKDDLI